MLASGEGELEEGELAGEVAQGLAKELSALAAAFQALPGEEGLVGEPEEDPNGGPDSE